MGDVKVIVYGRLKEHLGEETIITPGQSVRRAVESLQLSATGGLPLTPVVNGRVAEWDYVLEPGDELVLVPTIGGGLVGGLPGSFKSQ
jgi:molybdopterin converting factor small subunit